MHKVKNRFFAPNQVDGVTTSPVVANSIPFASTPVQVRRLRFTLAAKVLSMSAANDYGSLKICDLPTKNLIVLGAVIDLTGIVAGFASNVGTAVDAALGTAATASADFSGTNEDNLIGKVDGTGAGTTVTLKSASGTEGALSSVLLPAGAKALYLNASDPVTTGTGTITLTGYIDLYVVDVGDHA